MHTPVPDDAGGAGCILSCYGAGAPDALGEAPFFSWKTYGFAGKQKAYELIAASSAENAASGKGDVWDSGWVESQEDQRIPWEGKAPESNRDYYCAVRIRDGNGKTSAYSKALKISTGLISTGSMGSTGSTSSIESSTEDSCWGGAVWISNAIMSDAGPLFRREFKASKPVKRGRLFICGLGYYEAYINEKKLGDNLLTPSWTVYSKRVCYVAHDVTSLITNNNALGVMLGNGWYTLSSPFARPAFIARLILEYEDGSRDSVITAPDSGWSTTIDGPVRKNSIYIGEIYNALKERPGWAAYGFDEKREASGDWIKVVESGPQGSVLAPMTEEPIRVVGELKPVSLNPLGGDLTIVDFGQNMAGAVRLRMNCPSGTRVKIRYAELLRKNGTLNTENLRRAQQEDVYYAKGGGEEYTPRFTYHGFRYAEVSGIKGLKSQDIAAVVLRNAVSPRGFFSCSNELINNIQRICVWTESNNLHSVPTDCPQRDERMGWLNDLTVRAEEAVYNFDLSRFYRKFLADIADAQDPVTGTIPDTVPHIFGARPADAVCSSYLILAWLLYMHYGDKDALVKHYDGLAAWTRYLESRLEDGIVNYSYYGDWAAAIDYTIKDASGNGAASAITPGKLMSTGFLCMDARIMTDIARVLNRDSDAAAFKALAEKTKEALNRVYLNREKGCYASNSQGANAFMLYLDIVPDEYRSMVVRNLVDDIKAHNVHLTTGNLCTRYIFDVLARNGQIDLAFELAAQTSYPSWGFMLANGATTTWERWEYVDSGPILAMASHDHPMYSTISGWFYSYLLGIRPTEPGFKSFIFKPHIPKALSHAEGLLKSVKGDIKAGWKTEDGHCKMNITVPFNSFCRAVLPFKGSAEVNGESRGITEQNGEAFIILESGSYEILNKGFNNENS
ncbi:MAG: glycoside hydrolase family 78 protein [Treponema sp.]|nr:glycoside hydrolase family 78 protein [Treponema sp.]